jgi:GTP-binding protein
MFIDRTKIKVTGGNGGNGCVSFRREKYVPKGGPDGGDGGRGGDVVLRAVAGEQSLVALRYMPHYEGQNGGRGSGKKQHGANGADTLVDVPIGTVVYDAETSRILADLVKEGDTFVAASGGKGGRGNCRFVSSERRAPRIAEDGTPGEQRELALELKTVADVGFIGYPNAGKSTLIRALSDAHPKTAPYPFTTLHPVVGVVEFPDFFRYTVADIPGLIEGAHENVGLGHEFLRHIERCRVLIYVVDTAGSDGRRPPEDLAALKRELELHQPGLSDKAAAVVANKMDLPEAGDGLPELEEASSPLPVFPICALDPSTTVDLVRGLRRMLEAEKSAAVAGKFRRSGPARPTV